MAIVFSYSEMKSLCFIKNSKTYLMEWKGESVKGEKCIHGSAFSQESPKSQTKINFLLTLLLSILTIWLNPWAGKMKWILCSDWLAELNILPSLYFPHWSRKKCCLFVHFINPFIYCPSLYDHDGCILALFFFAFLLTKTKTQKRTRAISSHLDLPLGQ